MRKSIAFFALLVLCLFATFADAHGGVQFAPAPIYAGHCQSAPVFIPRDPIYVAPAPVIRFRSPVYHAPAPVFLAPQQTTIIQRERRGPFGGRSQTTTTVIQR